MIYAEDERVILEHSQIQPKSSKPTAKELESRVRNASDQKVNSAMEIQGISISFREDEFYSKEKA